jgi:hypothetical protein
MKRILLDNHVFDKLKVDDNLCTKIRVLAEQKALEIIVTRTIAEELYKSPHTDVLQRFPYRYTGNTVAQTGLLCCGDSIGSGDTFYKHLGESKQINDAHIVDAASWHADWLVSDDKRLRRRAKPLLEKCEIMSFSIFNARILSMANELIDGKISHEPDL